MDDRKKAILAEIPRLRRYARALARDADLADDLVQDCLERALTHMDNWITGESPRRWLLTIMHHIFIDQVRKTKRRSVVFVGASNADQPVQPSQMETLKSHDVLAALQAVEPDRRAALALVAIEGLSYAEAASVLGIPAGTLMSRIARGRAELRAVLDDNARRRAIRVVER